MDECKCIITRLTLFLSLSHYQKHLRHINSSFLSEPPLRTCSITLTGPNTCNQTDKGLVVGRYLWRHSLQYHYSPFTFLLFTFSHLNSVTHSCSCNPCWDHTPFIPTDTPPTRCPLGEWECVTIHLYGRGGWDGRHRPKTGQRMRREEGEEGE